MGVSVPSLHRESTDSLYPSVSFLYVHTSFTALLIHCTGWKSAEAVDVKIMGSQPDIVAILPHYT